MPGEQQFDACDRTGQIALRLQRTRDPPLRGVPAQQARARELLVPLHRFLDLAVGEREIGVAQRQQLLPGGRRVDPGLQVFRSGPEPLREGLQDFPFGQPLARFDEGDIAGRDQFARQAALAQPPPYAEVPDPVTECSHHTGLDSRL